MPFGKTIKRVVAYIDMENCFDIEVYALDVFIKLLKLLPVTVDSLNRGLVQNTTNFRAPGP